MKLTCPACGAVASAEAWANDAKARQALKAASGLPDPAARHALGYIALFRPSPQPSPSGGEGEKGGRGLSWSRALRLIVELAELVGRSHIQWDGKVARPITPALWGQALEKLLDQPPQRLPLKSHGYLSAIAYDIADAMDRDAEKSKRKVENSGRFRRKEGAETRPERIDRGVLREIRKGARGRVSGVRDQEKG